MYNYFVKFSLKIDNIIIDVNDFGEGWLKCLCI